MKISHQRERAHKHVAEIRNNSNRAISIINRSSRRRSHRGCSIHEHAFCTLTFAPYTERDKSLCKWSLRWLPVGDFSIERVRLRDPPRRSTPSNGVFWRGRGGALLNFRSQDGLITQYHGTERM